MAISENALKPATIVALAPFLAIGVVAVLLPFVGNDYWAVIGTRAAIYWVLVAGLNLIVGFAGQLAIGYVALLTVGAYVTSILAAGTVLPPVPLPLCFAAAAGVGALFRHFDARIRNNRHPDRAGLAQRHRRRRRPGRS